MSDPAPADSAPGSAFARNIPLYYLFQFVRGFHFWLPIWFLFLQSQHGLSYVQIGLMEVLFGIATILAEVPTGAIADRFGRRVALGFGALGFAGATVLFALLNFPALIVGHLFMSITRTLMSGSDDALLFDSLRQLRKTDEYERHAGRASAVATASLLAATILAGPLVSVLDFRTVIIISAVGMGLAGLIALSLREPPRRESDISGRRRINTRVPAQEPPWSMRFASGCESRCARRRCSGPSSLAASSSPRSTCRSSSFSPSCARTASIPPSTSHRA